VATASNVTAAERHSLFPRHYIVPFILVTTLFFLWGIPHNLNDILIRQFMKSFEMNRVGAGLIQSAFYLGYFLWAMPAALLMRRRGYKFGLLTGLALYCLGTLLFWPAALVGRYWFFLLALFVIASGLGFLETGANPFIAQLGDPDTSERRLNFSQAFNPFGAISGALIGTVFIFSGVELLPAQINAMKAAGTYNRYLRAETMRVIAPYLVLCCIVFVIAVLIARTRFPQMAGEDQSESADHGHFRDLFQFPHYVQAVIAQFLYVGAQVGTWSYFIQYIQDYTRLPEKPAGYLLTGTLVAFCVGRFSSTVLMRYIRPNALMGFYSLANVALLAIAVLLPGWIGMWSIFLTSFFMSLMFPTIFALGIKGLGVNTKIGGSLLVMGVAGGGAFTPLMGFISKNGSMALAMLVPLACYVFIAWYSFVGSRVRHVELSRG
jgi:FHS family L-fucose permease-like MFS transporter